MSRRFPGGLIVGSVLLAVTLLLGRSNGIDLDLFHELALAREGLLHGRWIADGLPTGDPFAFTPTHPVVVHHEWGTGAVLLLATAPLDALAPGWGAAGLSAVKWVALLATLALLAVCAGLPSGGVQPRRSGDRTPSVPPPASPATFALALLIAAPLLVGGLATVRAQNFTLLLTAALSAWLWADRAGRRRWVAGWPAVFALWVNLHAGFLVGVGLFGLHLAERLVRAAQRPGGAAASGTLRRITAAAHDARHLLAAAAAMPALVLLNPYGRELIPYLWRAVRMDRPRIGEWLPLWHTPADLWPWGMLCLAALAAGWGSRKRTGRLPAGWPLVAVTAWLALTSARHGSVFAVVWLAHAPRWAGGTAFDRLLAALPRTRPLVCGTLAAALLFSAGEGRGAARDVEAGVARQPRPAARRLGEAGRPPGRRLPRGGHGVPAGNRLPRGPADALQPRVVRLVGTVPVGAGVDGQPLRSRLPGRRGRGRLRPVPRPPRLAADAVRPRAGPRPGPDRRPPAPGPAHRPALAARLPRRRLHPVRPRRDRRPVCRA